MGELNNKSTPKNIEHSKEDISEDVEGSITSNDVNEQLLLLKV